MTAPVGVATAAAIEVAAATGKFVVCSAGTFSSDTVLEDAKTDFSWECFRDGDSTINTNRK